MTRYLANENVPVEVTEFLRHAGFDVESVLETMPGASDEVVLKRSVVENRILLTFDRDFGELVFRAGKRASSGIILFRARLKSPSHLTEFVAEVLSHDIDWTNHFSVAREGSVRVIPLPDA